MIKEIICKECGCSYEGDHRSIYCIPCRYERQKRRSAAGKARERKGLTRKLGSTDTCERCKKDFVVKAGLQRFCEDCRPEHILEYDRETSLPFYHEHKTNINPVRNERRRQGIRNCDWCGNEHQITVGSPTTCSPECKRLLKNKKWNERYHNLKG